MRRACEKLLTNYHQYTIQYMATILPMFIFNFFQIFRKKKSSSQFVIQFNRRATKSERERGELKKSFSFQISVQKQYDCSNLNFTETKFFAIENNDNFLNLNTHWIQFMLHLTLNLIWWIFGLNLSTVRLVLVLNSY